MKEPVDSDHVVLLRTEVLVVLLLAAIVAVAYSTAVSQMVAHTDDYWLLWEWRQDPAEVRALFNKYGRPVNGWIFSLAWSGVKTVDDLWQPRLVSAIGVGLLTCGIYASLRRLSYSLLFSAGLSAAAALLPTFCVYVTWSVCCAYVYGCLLALVAFWIAQSARNASWPLRIAALACAAGVLLGAFCTYQPVGLFYVVPVMFWIASPSWSPADRDRWINLALHAAVLAAAMGTGFIVFRQMAGEVDGMHDVAQRAVFTTDIVRKAGRFVLQPVAQSCAGYFFISDWGKLPLLALVVSCLGALFPLGMWQRMEGSWVERSARIVTLLALVPVCYVPNLLVASDFFPYRTRPAISVAVLFLLALGASGLLRRFVADERLRRQLAVAGLAAFLALAATVMHGQLVSGFIVPSQIEWAVVRAEVAREANSKTDRPEKIVFVMADSNKPVARRFIYDEFGYVSTSLPWVCEGMTGSAILAVAPEKLPALAQATLVQVPREQEPPPDGPNRWLIRARQVNDLGRWRQRATSLPKGHDR